MAWSVLQVCVFGKFVLRRGEEDSIYISLVDDGVVV